MKSGHQIECFDLLTRFHQPSLLGAVTSEDIHQPGVLPEQWKCTCLSMKMLKGIKMYHFLTYGEK